MSTQGECPLRLHDVFLNAYRLLKPGGEMNLDDYGLTDKDAFPHDWSPQVHPRRLPQACSFNSGCLLGDLDSCGTAHVPKSIGID